MALLLTDHFHSNVVCLRINQTMIISRAFRPPPLATPLHSPSLLSARPTPTPIRQIDIIDVLRSAESRIDQDSFLGRVEEKSTIRAVGRWVGGRERGYSYSRRPESGVPVKGQVSGHQRSKEGQRKTPGPRCFFGQWLFHSSHALLFWGFVIGVHREAMYLRNFLLKERFYSVDFVNWIKSVSPALSPRIIRDRHVFG